MSLYYKGFTLIELLIVMAILTVIASQTPICIWPNTIENDVITTQMSNIEVSLDTYRLDMFKYPSSLEALVKNTANSPKWQGPYLKKVYLKILGVINTNIKSQVVKGEIMIYMHLELMVKKVVRRKMPIYSKTEKKSTAGFTLLELIVVMVIIGMMAMLVIPNIGSGQSAIIKAQVREAMAVLRYTRRSATIEGKQKTIILREGGESAKRTNVDSGIWTSRGVKLQMGEPDDDTSEKTNTNTEVTFFPEGGSSGGKITFTFNKITAEIKINPLTGKIKSDIFASEDEDKK